MNNYSHPAQIDIPARFFRAKFQNWEGDSERHEKVRRVCRDYADKVYRGEFGNLLLCGPVGVGKTHLGCAVLRLFCFHRQCANLNRSALFVTADDIIRTVQGAYGGRANADPMTIYQHVELLMIDDLGSERLTEDSRSILSNVIDARNSSVKPTIITSNLTMAQIAECLHVRVASRLQDGECTAVVGMQFASYRGVGKETVAK